VFIISKTFVRFFGALLCSVPVGLGMFLYFALWEESLDTWVLQFFPSFTSVVKRLFSSFFIFYFFKKENL